MNYSKADPGAKFYDRLYFKKRDLNIWKSSCKI